MLGLPSPTEVHVRLPKEAFYRNMSIDAATKRAFVEKVESIVVMNSIKPSTSNISDGNRVHEILVAAIEPRNNTVPDSIVRTVCSANSNRILTVDTASGEVATFDFGQVLRSVNISGIELRGRDLDATWNSILAQVALGEKDGTNIQARIERRKAIMTLRTEIGSLSNRARKEGQFARKNELFTQMMTKKTELKALERDGYGEDR